MNEPTVIVSVTRNDGRIYPGPGRANLWPDLFSRGVVPRRTVYPDPERRTLFAR